MTLGADVEARFIRKFQEDWAVDNRTTIRTVALFFDGRPCIQKKVRETIKHWLRHGYTPAQRQGAGKRHRRSAIDE